jgi:hypothetical protein
MATNDVNIGVGLDLTNFKAGVQQIDAAFEKATNTTKKAGKTMAQGINEVNKTLKLTESEIIAATNQIKKWEKELKSATDKKRIEELNSNLRNTKKELEGIGNSTAKAKGNITSFGDHAKNQFKQIGAAIVAAFAFQAVKQFFTSSVQSFKEAETAMIQLSLAYGDNKAGMADIVATSKEFQASLNIPDDVFQSQAAFLRLQGRTNDEIKKIIKTAQGLKIQLGTDLQGAVVALNESYDGGAGKLEKFRSGTQKLTAAQLQNGAMVDDLFGKYGALAEEMAGTGVGALEETALNWDNVKESMGSAVIGVLEASGAMDLLNEKLILMTDTLSDERLSAMQRFSVALTGILQPGTGVAEDLQAGLNANEETVKEHINNLIKARKEGNEEMALGEMMFLKRVSKDNIDLNRLVLDAVKDTNNEILAAQADQANKAKVLSDEQKAAREKANAEWIKATEELYKRLRQLQIENDDSELSRIARTRNAELEDLSKVKANEEAKAELRKEIILKYQKQFEKIYGAEALSEEEIKKINTDRLVKLEQEKINKVLAVREEDVKEASKAPEISEMDLFLSNLTGEDSLEKIDEIKEKLKDAFKEMASAVSGYVQNALASYTELKQQEADIADEKVNENLKRIQIEQDAQAQGLNNSVDALKERDKVLVAQREKAQRDLEKAKKIELAVNTALEASNLSLAIAKLFATNNGIPIIGTGIAIAMSALMVSSFIASKAIAFKAANTTKYAKGGYDVLDGPDHAHGGIKFGNNKEAQGGEGFAVFNREATQRNSGLEAFVNAINTGKLVIDRDKLSSLSGSQNNIIVNVGGQKELSRIEKLLYEQSLNQNGANYKRYGSSLIIYKN